MIVAPEIWAAIYYPLKVAAFAAGETGVALVEV